SVKAQKVIVEEPAKPQAAEPRTENGERRTDEGGSSVAAGQKAEPEIFVPKSEVAPEPAGATGSIPQGTAVLDKIRPHMRRNRRGPGGSGSTTFLSRAL